MRAQEIKASIRYPDVESKAVTGTLPHGSEGLNAQQIAAVEFDHQNGSVLVLAGAGSGKTTVLTRRIARLCKLQRENALKAAGAGGILALTFTKDAALEMEGRLHKLLDSDATLSHFPPFPQIGTFHAFAYGMIRAEVKGMANWKRLGFEQSPVLMDSVVRRSWVRGMRRTMDLKISVQDLEGWLDNPFTENSALFNADPATFDETDSELRKEIRGRFRSHLLNSGCIGFEDMVALALRLFQDFPQVLADFQSRTTYVLVDEFQDTSRDQLELVRILMGESRNLFLVGDDDQAIYGFRGADPGNIRAALDSFPGMQIIKLETNYRSTPAIVKYANSVFGSKAHHLRKRLVAGGKVSGGGRPPPVRKIIHSSGADQAHWIGHEILRLHQKEGLAWSEMAILYRLNVLEPYYRSLLERLVGNEAAGEVVLSTVHGAKGLEYPAVFFVGLEDGILPYRRRGESMPPERLAEERRIFYVGVTRARRFLYLCATRRRILRGKAVSADISPFLHGRIFTLLRRFLRRE